MLRQTSERQFCLDDEVGIAIQKTDFGHHVGLFHRGAEGANSQLHLAWHHRLVVEPIVPPGDGGFTLWSSIQIPKPRLKLLSAQCRLVAQKNEAGIAYGLTSPEGTIDEDGFFIPTSAGAGLTCASFILAVFESARFILLNFDEWIEREDDKEWVAQIVALLRKTGASQEHIEGVENSPAIRFRPSEVTGAAMGESYPATFCSATARGKIVLDNLE